MCLFKRERKRKIFPEWQAAIDTGLVTLAKMDEMVALEEKKYVVSLTLQEWERYRELHKISNLAFEEAAAKRRFSSKKWYGQPVKIDVLKTKLSEPLNSLGRKFRAVSQSKDRTKK